MLRLILFTLCFFEAVTAWAGLFNPKTFQLDNGLSVVVLENHRAPVVSHMVWYKVGSADDPETSVGLAHYLEHLMFKGPKGTASAEMDQIMNRIGGSFNASTSYDFTNYYEIVAADQLETVMRLEAERMEKLTILDEQALPEKDVVLEERRMRYEMNPFGRLFESVSAVWYWRHPYGRPAIGFENDIKDLTPEAAREFHKKWYAPNNAVLIVAGAVTVDEVKKLAKKYYGKIPSRPVPERNWLKEPSHGDVEQTITVYSKDVVQPSMVFLYPAPNFKDDKDMAYAIQVLDFLLSEGATSKFYKSLVEGKKIAAGISFVYNIYSRQLGHVYLTTSPNPGHTLENLEKAVIHEIEKLLHEGITKEEVEKAKERMLAKLVYLRDNALSGASEFGGAFCVGQTIEEIEAWPERIKAVTTEQVNKALKTIFLSKQKLKGYLLPEAKRN